MVFALAIGTEGDHNTMERRAVSLRQLSLYLVVRMISNLKHCTLLMQ